MIQYARVTDILQTAERIFALTLGEKEAKFLCFTAPSGTSNNQPHPFMYNKPLTIAATTLLLCSPVMILTSCEGKKDSAGQMPTLVPEVQVTKLVTKEVPIRQ